MLHPKIEALRSDIGHKPIHYFIPSKSEFDKKPIEIRSPKKPSENERLIKQYFCIFGVPDDYRTIPVKGCFTKSLNERGPKSASNYKVVVLNQHDQKDPLCLPSVLEEDEVGLYGEYEPDPMESGDRLILQVRRGTINQGSYGFNYIWDKMEYIEEMDAILMHEVDLQEVSPVTIGSQKQTFVVRSKDGELIDEFLGEETEEFIKSLPRKYHLELRCLIDRHITLAEMKPIEQRRKSLQINEPQQGKEKLSYLINNFKL